MQEVPVPKPPPGGLLVRTTHSVISVGTEKMKVEQAKMNLLQKARARPDQVRKVLDTARNLGWKAALDKVRNRLETPTPLGYSAAGLVEAVHPQNTRFRVGDRVACGGAECAFHADYIAVPDMLAAPIPEGLDNGSAAYTTIASIALQAVRQAEPRLGERFLVMGQGLVGLLVTNILVANGVRVLAADLAASRKPFAESLGAERVVILGQQQLSDEVRAWTEGYGVDGVILCTATGSNAPIEQSADALRDRGRLVIVGNTKSDLAWKSFYEKELDVRYSRSYGPGRYDDAYEWGGTDYPMGYVRWTEQRNFQACMHLMQTGKLDVGAITTRRVLFPDALTVYQDLLQEGAHDVGVVLEYPDALDSNMGSDTTSIQLPTDKTKAARSQKKSEEVVGLQLVKPVTHLDVIGAGNFARTMLLPHLKGHIGFGTVVNATSLSANHVRDKFEFSKASTEASDVLSKSSDSDSALLIATRHHLHASLVQSALEAHRHVFVEKPLCLTIEEMKSIETAATKSRGSVMVGFNRRFAPATVDLKQALSTVPGPKTAVFRVMAGKLDPSHWYANYNESGGRVLGEACHFLDYFCFLFGTRPVQVLAQTTWPAGGRLPFPDSVTAQAEFADGSCGQLVYSAEGDVSWPKEQVTVFGAGLVGEITNFQKLVLHRKRKTQTRTYGSKGHAEEMKAWRSFLDGSASHPLPLAESRKSMSLTFAVLDSIRQARSVAID